MSFVNDLSRVAKEYGLELTSDQISAFNRYYELLIEWNEKINLTAITEPREVAIKHIVDSLSCYQKELFTGQVSLIDVGTGAGFPGLPLKIFYPELKLTLLDSLNKRVKFLQLVVDELGLKDVEVIHARSEEAARNKKYREKFDLATARAVARLPIICEYCLPFVKQGGTFIALKGRQYEEEIQEAQKAFSVLGGKLVKSMPVKLPELEDKRAVVYIKKEKATPKVYPRKAGTPERNPII